MLKTQNLANRKNLPCLCGIALEAAYINSRIAALDNAESEETSRFRRLYGDQHWQNVLLWFRQAQQELAAA
ncbi:MAG: hypothetical protein Q8N96_11870 [Methylovulum sp.]|nr:hypothetical protein [Methylovulum sp.]